MKLDVLQKNRQIDSSSDESIDYGIDTSQMGLLYQILSQYSNPIGSMVRELVTNAFDSHIEAGVDDRVTVRIKEKNELTNSPASFEVEDYGVGLSPDRIRKVYSKFLASTKRETNDQHGAFGLGSKSPFSYTDMFFVITRYNGTEYFYALHKGSNHPKIELLEKSSTDERNGTVVNVNIKPGNIYSFKKEVKRQLAYFDNVDHVGTGVDNDYRIFQGKHFIFREHANDLNLGAVHACLGKVYYPIDSSVIKFERNNPGYGQTNVRTPIGLKFEIGDIPIVWSRENLEYTDEAIKAIQEKYELAQEELKQLYKDQQDDVTDLYTYYHLQDLAQKDSLSLADDVVIPYISDIIKLDVKFSKYEKLPNFPKLDETVKLVYKYHKSVKHGRAETPRSNSFPRLSITDFEEDPVYSNAPIYEVKDGYSTLKNKFLTEVNKEVRFDLIKKREGSEKAEEKEILKTFGYDETKFSDIPDDEVQLIKSYTVEALNILKKSLKNYDKIKVTEEFKLAKKGASKKGMFDPSSSTFDPTLKIHLKEAYSSSVKGYRAESGFKVYEPTIGALMKHTNALRIYGFQEDSDILEDVAVFLHRALPDMWNWGDSRHKQLSILKIAKNKEELLLETSDNAIHVQEFLSKESKVLVRELTYYYIYSELEPKYPRQLSEINFQNVVKVLGRLGLTEFMETLLPAARLISDMQSKYYPITNGDNRLGKNIPQHIIHLFNKPAYLDPSLIELYEKAQDYVAKYPLLYKLVSTDHVEDEVIEELQYYLKGKNPINPSLERRLREFKEDKLLSKLQTTIYEDYNE